MTPDDLEHLGELITTLAQVRAAHAVLDSTPSVPWRDRVTQIQVALNTLERGLLDAIECEDPFDDV